MVPTPRTGRRRKPLVGAEPGDPVSAYLAEISREPRLPPDALCAVAGELEAATRAYREALYSFPSAVREVVSRWRRARSQGRATGPMGDLHGRRSPEDGARLDACLARLEPLLADPPAPDSERRAVALLLEANLSRELERRLHRSLLQQRRELEGAARDGAPPGAPETALGLPARVFQARLASLEAACRRMADARERLVRPHLRLVVGVARNFQHLGLPLSDLIQEGNLGLLRAAERFDSRAGAGFATYAVWWIRHALVRAIQNHARAVRLPVHVHEALRAYRSTRLGIEARLGRAADAGEVARAMSLPVARIDQLACALADPLSLDVEERGEPRELARHAAGGPPDDAGSDPAGAAVLARLVARVHELLAALPDRERAIVCWRYGLGGDDPLTLKEVGARLHLSGERVRQLEAIALRRLQRRLA